MIRLRTLLPAVTTLAAVALVTAPGTSRPAPKPAAPTALSLRADTVPSAGELGAAQPVPGDAALVRTAGKSGVVPAGAWTRARNQALQTAARTKKANAAAAAQQWQLQGPSNIGGRVLDVVVDPLHENAIYVATATGGIWYSDDAGKTFEPRWPDTNVQTIGALAVAPDGTLYAGTGEAGPGGGSLTYGGDGVYRSRDGGQTWQNVGLGESERIGRVVVDPKDPQRIWVAANGPLFRSDGQDHRGLFLSTDGGDTWTKKLNGKTPTTGAVDLAIAPDDGTLYAAMWDRLRHPDSRDYTGGGSALYRSKDDGETWAAVGSPTFGPDNETVGRLGVAAAPGGIVYVLSSTMNGLTGGFHTSANGGDTFTPKSFDSELVTGGFVYAWWFGRVYVDPKNPQHVFATGVNLSRSTDGGTNWSAPGGLHADQHGMAWDPRVADRVYMGNDGGVYLSEDNGVTWEHGEYMPWNQLFAIDVSQQTPSRIVGGLQDNGGNRSWDPDGETATDGWNDITGGDGTEMRINPKNEQIVYGCSQYGACAVSTNGGNQMSSFDAQIVGARKNWLTPIEFDPVNPSIVYTASSIVHRSTNDGQDWEPISLDLTDGEAGSTETNPLFRNYDTVSTIAVTDADTGFILVGTDDGRVWYSHDNAANPVTSWTESTDADLPDEYVTSVAIDQANPEIAYATFSGFRAGSATATVFRSADKGATWENISGDLPQAPVNKVLVVGDTLFVGTDVGVFFSKDLGKHWYAAGTALPMAPIWDLAYQAKTHTLYAANFGRGAYTLPLKGLAAIPVVPPTGPGTGPGSGPGTGPGNPPPAAGPQGPIAATGLPGALPVAAVAGSLLAVVALRRRRASEHGTRAA